jgi:hypothetical protein
MKRLIQSTFVHAPKAARTWRAAWFAFSLGMLVLGISADGEWGMP